MIENKDSECMVTVPVSRYEELIDFETRTNVVVDYILNTDYCSTEMILRILGTKEALKRADEMKEEDDRAREEMLRKYEDSTEGYNSDVDL